MRIGSFMSSLAILIIVLLAAALVVCVVYVLFLRSRVGNWKRSVLIHQRGIQANLNSAQADLKRLTSEHEKKEAELQTRYRQEHLATMPIEELARMPNIGPATVAKLKESGIGTILKAKGARFNIDGIGPKRAIDIQEGIRIVCTEVDQAFKRGGFPAADRLERDLVDLNFATIAMRSKQQQEIDRAKIELERIAPFVALAEQITFFKFVTFEKFEGLTPEFIQKFWSVAPATSAVPATPAPVAAPPPIKTPPAKKPEHPRLPHFIATVQVGYAAARADGKIAQAERDAIRKLLKDEHEHEPELNSRIDPMMEQVGREAPPIEETVKKAKALFDPTELRRLYDFACRVIDSTGPRNDKENRCLTRIAKVWEISLEPAAPAAPSPPPAPAPLPAPVLMTRASALAILEIDPNLSLSADLVRRQYRLLHERFDPAKMQGHGNETVAHFQEKRAKFEQAARFLLDSLGAKFEEEAKPAAPTDMRHNPDLDAVFGV